MSRIVFPALLDLESQRGDTVGCPPVVRPAAAVGDGGGCGPTGPHHPPTASIVSGRRTRTGGGGSQGESTLPNSACDSSHESGADPLDHSEEGEHEQKISYSVSYFSWSVSSEDEDEASTVTLKFDRLKIRKSSRERNEGRQAAAAAVSNLIASPPSSSF